MKAEEKTINDILSNKKYIIPSYQRPYSWNSDNALQLIDDIYTSFKEGTKEYFIGSLICIAKATDTYEVVDGQQRLTTIGIILAALKNQISKQDIENDLQQKIILKDIYGQDNAQEEPRLRVRSNEYDLYTKYILQGDKSFLPTIPTYTERLFLDNFEKLQDYFINLKDNDELCKLAGYILHKVLVVSVTTDSFTSSYRLFNVLNTRGLSLSQADLLKNRLFEIAAEKGFNQQRIESYWDEIETLVGIENMDKFLITHTISQKTNRNKAVPVFKLAEDFYKLIKDKYNNDAEKFILELKKSAENFQKIKEINFNNSLSKVFRCLFFIPDEWVPPVLSFLNKLNDNNTKLTKNDFDTFIYYFEKVYMHRWFTKQVKSQREVVCYAAISDINNNKTIEDIIQTITHYKNNDGLINYLNSDVYIPRSNRMNLIKYVLFRIEESLQDESVTKNYHGTITIEHILPQTMTDKYWKARFSIDDHVTWINKIGNLTLLSGSKNSKAQNSGFDKKHDIYNASNSRVSFDLTKDVLNYTDWDLEALQKRNKKLIDISKNIWLVR